MTNAEKLALLERSHLDAQDAAAALKVSWKQEDAVIAEQRKKIWAAHEQGARDRDAMRVEVGGASLIEAEERAAEAAAAARLKAADDAAAELKKANAAQPEAVPKPDTADAKVPAR